MANHQPLPEWPVRVEVHPAPGWVRIPHDPRPQGRFIKHDPCARVAEQLIRAGQVNKLMLRSTTEFLRRMSLDNLTNLWLGAFIEAPAPKDMLISTMVVLPPVETPMSPHSQGEVDYEELRRRAATKKIQGESDHAVQLVEFPWGRGYRSLSRRAHGQDPIDEAMTSIEYLVKGPVTPSTICVLGQVPATAAERTERLIGDIASMVSTLTVFVAPSD
jgi:hypothetical protein